MKLLVTGGAGYIGSIVGAQLVEAGHQVTVLDNLSKGHRRAVPDGARFIQGDLEDRALLHGVLADAFDGVLHFAARSLVAESVEQPRQYYRNNLCGTLNLLDAMADAGVPRLVFSSTAAVYGHPEDVPISETAPTRPTNPYGGSKLAVDQLIGFASAAHGLAAVILRYFNVAGASGPHGEVHDPETHLIPILLEVAAGRRDAVQVYGTDYPTRDGSAVRDYIHVEDLGRAHLLALHAAEPGRPRIYNLGNGAGFSVLEVIEAARAVTGHPIPSLDTPRRAGDPPILVASSHLIANELGWAPEKPELTTMIADAWAWMRASALENAEWPS